MQSPDTGKLQSPTLHEQRLARRMAARGEEGLVESLLQLKGIIVGGRYRLDSVYAIGGEGAVFDVTNLKHPQAPAAVAKVSLHHVHRPFDLTADEVRKRRYGLRVESQYLIGNGSPFMPKGIALYEFVSPVLDSARGDAFAELEPILVMEKLPGCDADRWLARTHRSNVPRAVMRRTLDRVAVVLLQALTDLRRRQLVFADLRPGNMRMMGRPDRRIRMLDAGSLVAAHDRSGRFPHVPAYLPPDIYEHAAAGGKITPSDLIQVVMAGRTLFEAATGRVPLPGEQVDLSLLPGSNVSPPVATLIERLCTGDFKNVEAALTFLSSCASRRVPKANDPRYAAQGGRKVAPRPGASITQELAAEDGDDVLPPSKKRRGLLARIFGSLRGK